LVSVYTAPSIIGRWHDISERAFGERQVAFHLFLEQAANRLQLGEPGLLGWKVKDAPTSTGSARPGRGRQRRPSVSDLEILEQDRTELDESEGRLAPGDDGVHAGAVAVVGADAAVAVAVQRRGVAAVPAIALAGDQIDEARFLGLLQGIPLSRGGAQPDRGRGARIRGREWRFGVSGSIGGLVRYAKREKRPKPAIPVRISDQGLPLIALSSTSVPLPR